MINDSPFGEGSLTVAAGGFEATGHPHWVIQRKMTDRSGLTPEIWIDCEPQWYNADAIVPIEVGGNGYSVKFNPVFLRQTMDAWRDEFTADEFRLVMRVEMQREVR